jgi:hypothetical protein
MGWVLIQIESMGNGITDSNSAEIRELKHPPDPSINSIDGIARWGTEISKL